MKLPCSPQPRVGVEVAEDTGNELARLDRTVLVADAEIVPFVRCEAEVEARIDGGRCEEVLAPMVFAGAEFLTDADVMLPNSIEPLKLPERDVAREGPSKEREDDIDPDVKSTLSIEE